MNKKQILLPLGAGERGKLLLEQELLMEIAQKSLFLSPACGKLSDRILLFTPGMSVPAMCAAALRSPSWP